MGGRGGTFVPVQRGEDAGSIGSSWGEYGAGNG